MNKFTPTPNRHGHQPVIELPETRKTLPQYQDRKSVVWGFTDLILETLKGKSLYRILFNWAVAKHCVNLGGYCVDLAAGKDPATIIIGRLNQAK